MLTRQIFLWLISILFVAFGTSRFHEYRINHTYYIDMLKNNTNIMLTLRGFVCGAIPTYMLMRSHRSSFKNIIVSIFAALILFGVGFIGIKETFIGNGIMMLVINMGLIFALGLYFILGLIALGSLVSRLTLKLLLGSVFDIVCVFGIGLGVYMLVNYILIMLGIYYSPLLWGLAIGIGILIYYEKTSLVQVEHVLMTTFRTFKTSTRDNQILHISVITLLLISFSYYFHGFMLAYIPYPTAWDANHAYMYIPKVFALVKGYLRANSMDAGVPVLRYSYIAFWFGLFSPLHKFWISPDTIAVEMNFLAGIFTLVGMLTLSSEVINLLKSYRNHSQTSGSAHVIHDHLFNLSRMYILLWLTSGMGAFLVFVDNKTDLGIMTLIILGLTPGVRLITNLIHVTHTDVAQSHTSNLKLAILSGMFFGIAVLSKPTALFDVMGYGLLYIGLLIGVLAVCGFMFLVPSILSLLKANNVDQYIPMRLARFMLVGGTIVGLGDTARHILAQQMRHAKYLLIRGISFVCMLLIFKAPMIVATSIHRDNPLSISILVKRVLLGYQVSAPVAGDDDRQQTKRLLLVSNDLTTLAQTTTLTVGGETVDVNTAGAPTKVATSQAPQTSGLLSCKPGMYSSGDLNKDLKEVIGSAYQEDVGRYVGYGQKEFKNPRWKFLFPGKMCLSLHADARTLCHANDIIAKYDLTAYQKLLDQVDSDSQAYTLLNQIITSGSTIAPDQLESYKADSIKKLNTYRSERTIKSTDDAVFVPYVYIIPFNISFNRSLQNLSSYYTDIGIVWLPLFFLVILALVYALIIRDRLLGVVALVTLFAWWMWMMIGGAILWYGIGLIIWSIITMMIFFDRLIDHRHDVSRFSIYHVIVLCIIFRGVIQFTLNFVRISSQGGGGPFVRYKFSNGTTQELDETLAGKTVNKFPYTSSDILNMQFPHYGKVIRYADQRTDGQILMIAGTYLQYFLGNQYNIFGDGFLTELWRLSSDGDQCKTYLRLKDKKRKYMAIDPNIGTVVMGGGNSTLFDRFFAKIDPVQGTIVQDGTMTMLSKMVSQGYFKMIYSNNLGAKYAYTLSDTSLAAKIGSQEPNMIALARARIATARFWQNGQQLIGLIQSIFTERMTNGDAIEDIADVFGKDIESDKLKTIASKLVVTSQLDALTIAQYTKDLNQDERLILGQYMQLLQLLKSNKAQFDQSVANLIGQSVGGSSQIIFFEIL